MTHKLKLIVLLNLVLLIMPTSQTLGFTCDKSIKFKGLYIGMPRNEAGEVYNVLSNKDDSKIEVRGFLLTPYEYQIDSISVTFNEEKIDLINVFYKNVVPSFDLLKVVSDDLEIEKSRWMQKGNEYEFACNETKVKVSISPNFLMFYRNTAPQTPTTQESSYIMVKPKVEKPSSFLPETCNLGLEKIPTIRGLNLGMSKSDVIRTYPHCADDDPLRCFYRVERLPNGIDRKNLDAITISFTDNDLISSFSIIYDDSIRWKSTKEFADIISESLNFQKEKWQVVVSKKTGNFPDLVYGCVNYTAKISMVDEYRPQLTLMKSIALINSEKEQEQSNRKKGFKP